MKTKQRGAIDFYIFSRNCLRVPNFVLNLRLIMVMAHGVTGNTSVFGTEESRFET